MNLKNVEHITINGKNVIRLAIGMINIWKGLPNGYTALDCIETTGTQYINTGFKPNPSSRIVCEALWDGGDGIYGTRTAVASNNFSLRVINGKWQSGYGKVATTEVVADKEWHTFDLNKNVFSVDGEIACTHEITDFTPPSTIALGGIKTATSMYYGKGKYRKCQIYDDGVLVRDFIPCIDPAGHIGMYDTINGKFYGNAGTGTFGAYDKDGFLIVTDPL